MMVKGGKRLAEILICLLREVHAIERSHQNAVELDCLSVKRALYVLQALDRLLFSNFVLTVVQSYLTDVSDSRHVVSLAAFTLL